MGVIKKITRHGQITIPKAFRDAFKLKEGDFVEVVHTKKGLLLRPKKARFVDPDQAYYWSDEWQEKERNAEADIKAGRVHRLNSLDDLDT